MKEENLPQEVYYVCRLGGTEPPFSGKYLYHWEEGVYHCVCCGTPLFLSTHKYDSGSGWPSFFQAIEENLKFLEDHSMGMVRTEVRCKTCDAHLGHLFPDGPPPTGKRY